MDVSVHGIGGLAVISALPRFVRILKLDFEKIYSFESRGIAQRRGSVGFQLRSGDDVCCPRGLSVNADLLVAFEAMEAVRDLRVIRPGTVCLISDLCVNTFGGTQMGLHRYPRMDQVINTIVGLGGIPVVVPISEFIEHHKLGKVFVSTALLAIFCKMMGHSLTVFWKLFPEFLESEKSRLVVNWAFELFELHSQQETLIVETSLEKSVA